jgi:hypothetical protein
VRAMFDGHETLFAAGAAIHFWAFASFARRDAGGDEIALPNADNNAAVVYRCDSLECVDVTPFLTVPRDGADGVEVLPLPPLVTTVVSAAMHPGRSKTLVITLQQQPNDGACYVVPRVAATPAFDKSAPLAVALLRLGLSEEQIVQDGWTALMALPLEVVVGALAAKCSPTMAAALQTHPSLAVDVLKVKPSSPLSCELWCLVVYRFAANDIGRKMLGTTEVRDALLALAPHATTDVVYSWCTAMCNLTDNNDANKQLFGTAAVRDTLVAMGAQATTAYACIRWCAAICSLTRIDAIKRLLGTEAVRDALVAVQPQATTADACEWWCCAISNMVLNTPANEQLLGTAAVRDALVAVQPHATTAESCIQWCAVICNLSFGDELGASPATRRNLQLFRVASVRKAHAALKRIASSSAQAKKLWDAAALTLADDE